MSHLSVHIILHSVSLDPLCGPKLLVGSAARQSGHKSRETQYRSNRSTKALYERFPMSVLIYATVEWITNRTASSAKQPFPVAKMIILFASATRILGARRSNTDGLGQLDFYHLIASVIHQIHSIRASTKGRGHLPLDARPQSIFHLICI